MWDKIKYTSVMNTVIKTDKEHLTVIAPVYTYILPGAAPVKFLL